MDFPGGKNEMLPGSGGIVESPREEKSKYSPEAWLPSCEEDLRNRGWRGEAVRIPPVGDWEG